MPRVSAEDLALIILFVLVAFAVPILGPLRGSDARIRIAIAILLIGAGVALVALFTRWPDSA